MISICSSGSSTERVDDILHGEPRDLRQAWEGEPPTHYHDLVTIAAPARPVGVPPSAGFTPPNVFPASSAPEIPLQLASWPMPLGASTAPRTQDIPAAQ